jgi:iron complex transport system substrate-binding protein
MPVKLFWLLIRITPMNIYNHLAICILLVSIGCHPGEQHTENASSDAYARGFYITVEEGIRKLTVVNPWEKARNIQIDYYLVDKTSDIPASLKGKNIIRTPVEKIICLSTTHLAFLDALGEISRVKGISGGIYVSHPVISQGVQNAEIIDVGYGQNLNFEAIIDLQPDVVMVYGVDSEITGFLSKFSDLGIPSILNAEYLETSPLGKAEWIKFAGELFNKGELADSIFGETERKYIELTRVSARQANRPKVMMGLPYRDAWWVPGGDSYMARLIADAGGDYIGSDNSSRESYVISFEEALMWASVADFWLNVGMVTSKSEILAADARFEKFRVFSQGEIFNNNRRATGLGGNDFWESGVVAPEVILADLISIFHRGALNTHEMIYYQEIK